MINSVVNGRMNFVCGIKIMVCTTTKCNV